jgi:hypothetical protein
MTIKQTRDTLKARFSAASAGVEANVTGKLTLGGVSYTAATLGAVFDDANTAMGAADTARSQLHSQVQAANTAIALALSVLASLRQYLITLHGDQAGDVLVQYGLALPKKPVKTPAVKAAAAVKAKATRTLRGTMGPKARLKVKSNVQVVTAEVPAAAAGAPASPEASGTGASAPSAVATVSTK